MPEFRLWYLQMPWRLHLNVFPVDWEFHSLPQQCQGIDVHIRVHTKQERYLCGDWLLWYQVSETTWNLDGILLIARCFCSFALSLKFYMHPHKLAQVLALQLGRRESFDKADCVNYCFVYFFPYKSKFSSFRAKFLFIVKSVRNLHEPLLLFQLGVHNIFKTAWEILQKVSPICLCLAIWYLHTAATQCALPQHLLIWHNKASSEGLQCGQSSQSWWQHQSHLSCLTPLHTNLVEWCGRNGYRLGHERAQNNGG